MTSATIPTIGAIQRTNLIAVVVTAALLGWLVSNRSALGCLLGGGVVIANLYVLALLGRVMLGAAVGASPAATRLGMLAVPLKLLLFVALLYLVFSRVRIDGLGFAMGVLTQLVAITIETGRAWLHGSA